MPHFMIVLIPCINLLKLSWIKKKMSPFEGYRAFNMSHHVNIYNFDPLKPHFIYSKTGVYRGTHYFIISAQRLWVLLRRF